MSTEPYYMSRAIALAERGFYTVRQNPRVGCVIVNENEVVGEGWHQRAGDAHAEIYALNQAGSHAKNADCYITLEPCAHTGKTPPCVQPLIESGVKRVIIGSLDPNPLVSGKGVAALREAGIEVEFSALETQALELNKGFFSRMQKQRPYVRVKMGMSLDGRIALANGKSQWITSEESRRDVQDWRARSCIILTSSQTVLHDDPQLNVRDETVIEEIEGVTGLSRNQSLRQPKRVVLDTELKTLPNMKVYQKNQDEEAIVITGKKTIVPDAWKNAEVDLQFLLEKSSTDAADLKNIMRYLADKEYNEVWVEAGAHLAAALAEANVVDEWILYAAPCFLGGDAKPVLSSLGLTELNKAPRLNIVECKNIGGDLRIIAKAIEKR